MKPIAEESEITSSFGQRRGRPHYGVDWNARRGTPVFASADGRVSFAGRQRGFGKIVIVDHPNGFQTYYAHLSEIAVREGKTVKAGARVGRVGATGNATGPHLHFEIRQNGVPLDPMEHIRP